MAMPAHRTDIEWTAEMARALPDDGNRYEVLDGELFVTPAPSTPHQRALRVLYDVLAPYVNANRIGELFWSPADIEFSPRRLVQPDVFVAALVDGKRPRAWTDVKHLLLAIEALSPTTARADRHKKRRIYMEEAVDDYWIVDVDARVIERWQRGDERPEVLAVTLHWQPAVSVAALVINLEEYFEEVWREKPGT
jgi:Uma2 family endonuclease